MVFAAIEKKRSFIGKMNKLPFFKFDAESWLTGKIQILPVDEIGIYINLMARIWKAGGELKNDRFLPKLLGAKKEQFESAMRDFLELGIVSENNGMLRIKFIDDQLEARAEFIAKCAAGGRRRQASKQNVVVVTDNDLKQMLGDLSGDFKRWLNVWKDAHGGGKDMPIYQQEAQIRMIISLPENIRQEAIERAIRGGWKAIHDIREKRYSGVNNKQTGTLTETPTYSANERGAK